MGAFVDITLTLTDMRAVSFFSRFAFICNIFFVVCLLVQRTHDFIGQKDISGVVITLGWFISPLLNLLVCILYTSLFLSRKPLNVATWLVVANFVFLFLQLFIHFILPS